MKRTNKKGFTIVELVVVIAIIAILAAVLIPTFASLIKRANVSKDQQLVRNLNTALIADKAINGKHETMYSALQAVADSGFDIARINDKKVADNEILWDSVSDVFCYRDGKDVEDIKYIPEAPKAGDVKPYQYWIIASAPSETYSTYLYKASKETFDHVTTGLDVGNENVTSITYEHTTGDPQTAVIRTNSASTTLIVNGYVDSSDNTKGDVVYHYGSAGALEITKCATGSYHENGNVAFAEIKTGRLVLESNSEIKHIHINANAQANGFEEVIIADNGAKALPEAITRDQVDVSEAKPVVTVESGSTSETVYVYPYTDTQETKTGTTEKTTNQNTTIATALGTLVLDNGSNAGEKAMSNNDKKAAKTEVVNEAIESVEYTGVAVTKAGEPTQLMTLEAFRDSVNAGNSYEGYTVKLLDNIDLNGVEWTPIGTIQKPFSGVFDGQNYTIKNYKISGTGEKVGLALFGCIKGTDDSTFTSTTDLSVFYNTTNYTVNLPAEEIFSCVVKNLNVSGADVNTTADGWTAAVVAYVENATISNIRLSNSTITAGKKVGGIVGFLPSGCACYITNCTTSSDVTVTASTGDHSAGILARVNTTDSRGIIANCTNNATIKCAGVNGGGIAGQAKNVLYYNNTNNGSVTGNTRAAGIATDCSGNVFINCTNNGYIKTTAVYSISSHSSAGIVAYLETSGNNVIVNCHNSGTIEGNAPNADTRIAGIAGGGVDKGDKIINNSNTGTLINKADGGKVYDICNLSSVANEVNAEDLTAINTATATDNKYIRFTGETTLTAGETVTFNGQEKIEFVNSPKYLTLDLSGANKSSFVLVVNDTEVTLINGSENYVTISGKGNTVKVDENETVKNLTILNDDKETESSFNISGNATKLVLKGNGLVNGEIAEKATVERVNFSGNGTFTLTNRGIISHTTSGIYANEHTIDTLTSCNITIHNYGTIEAKENSDKVASYALLFYGGATVKLYAYNGSNIIAEGNMSAIVTNGGTQVNVYYQDGAKVTCRGSQSNYPSAFGYYCTVTKMN